MLAQTAATVSGAKQAGIELVHGFFVVGSPDETAQEMRDTFRFAARLRLDTFAFNRLCVYRGTPLWREYLQRGPVHDETDWYKYFKCSSIDPTVLPGETIHRIRTRELHRLILYKLVRYPGQALRLLGRLARHMPLRDIAYLLAKPFLGDARGPTKAEAFSRAVEHEALQSAATDLTHAPDETLMRLLAPPTTDRAGGVPKSIGRARPAGDYWTSRSRP